MPRKPALKVVPPAGTDPPPPTDLGRHGRELWVAIVADYEVSDAADESNLLAACRTVDLAAQLEAELAREGVVGVSANALLKHLIACRALTSRLLKCVTTTPPRKGRPPGHTGGWT